MTTECQCFIDAAEIKGARLECSVCHVKVSVSLQTEAGIVQALDLCKRFACPHCKATWFTFDDTPYLDLVAKLIEAIAAIKERETGSMKLLFEVAPRP